MEEKFSLAYKEVFAKSKERGEKIVGVKFRTTDYVEMLMPGHPFQPTVEEMIKRVERFIEDYRYDKVFLAVDDINAREAFQRAFGEKLIYFSAPLMDYSKRSRIGNDDIKNNSAGYVAKSQLGATQATEAYLIELLLLARCDSLLAGVSSGTIYSVIAKNGEYEHLEILNLGKSKYWFEKGEESK